MKFGVIIFPGSNCDHDAYWTIQHVAKQPVSFLWHESHDLENCDAVIVPGGFAYGDYLRTGAIARFSPVMESVQKFADGGGLVMGICNGFQILCESGLLPGALMRNVGLKYVCKPVQVRVENVETPFTNACTEGEVLTIPIGHMEGNYFCDEATHAELRRWLANLTTLGYARSTIARRAAAVRTFYAWASGRGLVLGNPAALLGSPKPVNRLPAVQLLDLRRQCRRLLLQLCAFLLQQPRPFRRQFGQHVRIKPLIYAHLH